MAPLSKSIKMRKKVDLDECSIVNTLLDLGLKKSWGSLIHLFWVVKSDGIANLGFCQFRDLLTYFESKSEPNS